MERMCVDDGHIMVPDICLPPHSLRTLLGLLEAPLPAGNTGHAVLGHAALLASALA